MPTTARHSETGTRQVNLTLDREALDWLHKRSTTQRGHGQFLSRLLYQDRAVFEERKRQALVGTAGGDADQGQT